MVVIEAFACGVPVVTVKEKYNAAQGLIADGIDGFVVGLDEREIAKAIDKIIKEHQEGIKYSEAILNKAKKYDWDEIVKNVLIAYRGFIKKD